MLRGRLAEMNTVFRSALPAALCSAGCCANWTSDLTAYSHGRQREKRRILPCIKREGGNLLSFFHAVETESIYSSDATLLSCVSRFTIHFIPHFKWRCQIDIFHCNLIRWKILDTEDF